MHSNRDIEDPPSDHIPSQEPKGKEAVPNVPTDITGARDHPTPLVSITNREDQLKAKDAASSVRKEHAKVSRKLNKLNRTSSTDENDVIRPAPPREVTEAYMQSDNMTDEDRTNVAEVIVNLGPEEKADVMKIIRSHACNPKVLNCAFPRLPC